MAGWSAGGDDSWGGGETSAATDTWGNGGDAAGGGGWGTSGDDTGGVDSGDANGDDAGSKACRICNQEGHFARECPDKPAGGLTGECFNCGEVGHNKADCTNAKVDRPFDGTCNLCSEQGHSARNCPQQVCRLCKQTGHKASECENRRAVDWKGIPELEAEEAWKNVIDSAAAKDLDAFRVALKAYARALDDKFDLRAVEEALRDSKDPVAPIYLIAREQEVARNLTIVDLVGNANRKYVLSFAFSAKPRRKTMSAGWPESPKENLERLASAGFVQDSGIPVCSNCDELGHVRKYCKQEIVEREKTGPTISCIYCKEEGHRGRDCPKPRVNPFACRNCQQEGHESRDCPEPRSAAGVECRKCNEMGHFSKDCPNVEARPPRTCNNCGSEDHMAKECDQPRNPATITCRNCDEKGHMSRECPKPRDWSKVQCKNCEEFGHTIRKCPKPINDDDGGDGGGSGGNGWGNDAAQGDGQANGGGWGNDETPASGGWNDDAPASGGW